jgi:predicted glutamine amidotransferase
MCRFFFILEHKLLPREIKKLVEQRNQTRTKYSLSKKDYGPRLDGMGFAYRYRDNWIHRSCIISPDLCIQLLLDLPKESILEPVIIHLRQRCSTSNCKKSTAEIGGENTHPFVYKDSIFAHNGELDHFYISPNKLIKYIEKDLQKQILGKTDSEQMFYLFLTVLNKNYKKTEKIDFQNIHHNVFIPFLQILSKEYSKFLANIIFSNSEFSIITRFKHGMKSPGLSLYYSIKDGFLVASEPIGSHYKLVPEQTCIYIDHKTKHAFLQTIE